MTSSSYALVGAEEPGGTAGVGGDGGAQGGGNGRGVVNTSHCHWHGLCLDKRGGGVGVELSPAQ